MEHILTEREVKDLIEACRGALEEFNSVEVSQEVRVQSYPDLDTTAFAVPF